MKDRLWKFEDLKAYLRVGNNKTRKIGEESGGKLVMGYNTVRYDPETVKKYVKEVLSEKSS